VSQSRLGRSMAQRRALLRNLVTSFLREERIQTTEARAKSVSRLADKMITLGKRGDLHARRQVLSFVLDEDVTKKVFDTLAVRYAERNGGFTRVLKVGARKGDAAPMVILELV